MPAAADTCLCLTRACAAGSFVPRRLAGDHRRERSNRACPGWASPGTACAAGAPAHLSACSSAPQACSRAGSRAVLRLRLPCRDGAAEPDGSAPQARARSPAGYAVLRRRLAIQTSAPRHACRRRRRRRGASRRAVCLCHHAHEPPTGRRPGVGAAPAPSRVTPGGGRAAGDSPGRSRPLRAPAAATTVVARASGLLTKHCALRIRDTVIRILA